MKYIYLTILVFASVSCSTIKVNYDFDKETDFSNYSTYNYYSDMETGLSALDEKRLLDIMDITLQIKGLQYSEEPDFLINIISEAYQAPQNTSVGVGLGGTGRNVGGGVSVGIPVGGKNLRRQIQFDFVDAKKEELFWQATGESSLKENVSPLVREQKLVELVDKVFSKYPPKSNK
jgi:hypothetical protein